MGALDAFGVYAVGFFARPVGAAIFGHYGGPAPLIAAWLFGKYHTGLPIALFILGCAVVSLLATSMLKDYTNKDISAH